MKKFLLALVVWVVVAIICYLVGGLVATIDPVTELGAFLRDHAGLLGFLAGVVYFFFGGDKVRQF